MRPRVSGKAVSRKEETSPSGTFFFDYSIYIIYNTYIFYKFIEDLLDIDDVERYNKYT